MGITTKCSQERVGKELASMLSCKRPVLAFRMMDDLQLWPTIYGIHGKEFKSLVVYTQGEGDKLIQFECSTDFWASQFKLNVSLAKLLGWTWYSFLNCDGTSKFATIVESHFNMVVLRWL